MKTLTQITAHQKAELATKRTYQGRAITRDEMEELELVQCDHCPACVPESELSRLKECKPCAAMDAGEEVPLSDCYGKTGY